MMAALGATPGDVAAGPAEAGYEARSDRIETGGEDDRNRRSHRFCGQRRKSVGHDHGHLAADEFCRHRWKPVITIVGKAILDSDVLPLDESGLVKALPERTDEVFGASRRRGAEETDHRHRRLLCVCCERPGGSRAAKQRDELTASQLVELHSSRQPGPDRRISNWRGCVRWYGSSDIRNRQLRAISGHWLRRPPTPVYLVIRSSKRIVTV